MLRLKLASKWHVAEHICIKKVRRWFNLQRNFMYGLWYLSLISMIGFKKMHEYQSRPCTYSVEKYPPPFSYSPPLVEVFMVELGLFNLHGQINWFLCQQCPKKKNISLNFEFSHSLGGVVNSSEYISRNPVLLIIISIELWNQLLIVKVFRTLRSNKKPILEPRLKSSRTKFRGMWTLILKGLST